MIFQLCFIDCLQPEHVASIIKLKECKCKFHNAPKQCSRSTNNLPPSTVKMVPTRWMNHENKKSTQSVPKQDFVKAVLTKLVQVVGDSIEAHLTCRTKS